MNRDEHIPRELAALLAAERSVPPAPAGALERVHARLQATLAAGPTTVAATALSTKLIISLVLALIGAAGVMAYVGLRDRPPSPSARDETPAPLPPPVEVATLHEQTAQHETVAAPAEPNPAAASTPQRKRGEREILDEAMRCLAKRSAICALNEVAAHARQYPTGDLVEEREAIRVEALELSGDAAAAQERAKAFLAAYPSSVHVTRIRQIAEPH